MATVELNIYTLFFVISGEASEVPLLTASHTNLARKSHRSIRFILNETRFPRFFMFLVE